MRLAVPPVAAIAVAFGLVSAGLPTPASTQSARTVARQTPLTSPARFERAVSAWDAGRYDAALEDLRMIATGPDAATFGDRIAELTGEIWRTVEVAKDARAPRWSSDGRHLAYEYGPEADRRFRVVRAESGFPTVFEGVGGGVTFTPDGRTVGWVAPGAGDRATIAYRRLEGGDTGRLVLEADAVLAPTPFGRADGRVAVISGTPGDSTSALMIADGAGAWRRISTGALQPLDLVRSPDGSRIVVTFGRRGPFARGGRAGGGSGGGSGGGFSQGIPIAFAELLGDSLSTTTAGIAPQFSRDGSTLGWIVQDPTGNSILVRRGGAAAPVAIPVTGPTPAFALSPDGAHLTFQQMSREDWELFTVPADGSAAPERLTHEIQHDLLPQYLSTDRLLATIGESRHRRSHLYDLRTGARTRLFHNNSVRTVAPEYEWVPSPDGARVAIVAERDGDTVTPHRHLYLTDLTTKWTPAELVARLDSNLVAERALRANGERIFAPIAAAVREAAAEVDVSRIYGYEKDLFAFDSKHITQPGNWKATEYLLAKYRSFGLDAHLQRFRTAVEQGRVIEVANVVAVVPGTVNPELIYVVGAHFDSRDTGPGADDNTSGTAMILEAARVLSTRPLPATVMFVAFTAEESGLRGAREFGRRMKDSIRVVGALNNDMMGWSNDHRLDNTIRYSNRGIRDVQHAAAIGFSRLITYDAFYYKSTDAQALFDVWGDIIGGIGSYPILGNPHYHMPHDVLETINHQQVAETSRATVATIMLLASSPSRVNGLTATGTRAAWTASPERGVTRYLVRWGPAEEPMRHSATVSGTSAALAGAQPGWKVAVKAVNDRGLEGWDWARVDVR